MVGSYSVGAFVILPFREHVHHGSYGYLMTEEDEFMAEVGEKFGRRSQVQAETILNQTRELFAGGTLPEYDEIAFLTEMQQIFLDSKKTAKEKFTPKKYRKSVDVDG